MKNKAVIFMMSMVLAMGSAVPAHADTEISENKDLAENGQGVSEYANGFKKCRIQSGWLLVLF